jgi:hypothetical protein
MKEFDYGIYRLLPAPPGATGPVRLEIGVKDDVNVVRFHAKERQADTGLTFRWTRGLSYVLLQGISPAARELTIWMSRGGRPASAPPADVSVTIGGALLGVATPTDEIAPHSFALSPALVARLTATADPARLELRVATWSPAALVGGNDTRELGVLVTRVDVR